MHLTKDTSALSQTSPIQITSAQSVFQVSELYVLIVAVVVALFDPYRSMLSHHRRSFSGLTDRRSDKLYISSMHIKSLKKELHTNYGLMRLEEKQIWRGKWALFSSFLFAGWAAFMFISVYLNLLLLSAFGNSSPSPSRHGVNEQQSVAN